MKKITTNTRSISLLFWPKIAAISIFILGLILLSSLLQSLHDHFQNSSSYNFLHTRMECSRLTIYLLIISKSSGKAACAVSWCNTISEEDFIVRGAAAECRHHSAAATAKTSIGLNNHNLEPLNCRLRFIWPQPFLCLVQAQKKSI